MRIMYLQDRQGNEIVLIERKFEYFYCQAIRYEMILSMNWTHCKIEMHNNTCIAIPLANINLFVFIFSSFYILNEVNPFNDSRLLTVRHTHTIVAQLMNSHIFLLFFSYLFALFFGVGRIFSHKKISCSIAMQWSPRQTCASIR